MFLLFFLLVPIGILIILTSKQAKTSRQFNIYFFGGLLIFSIGILLFMFSAMLSIQ